MTITEILARATADHAARQQAADDATPRQWEAISELVGQLGYASVEAAKDALMPGSVAGLSKRGASTLIDRLTVEATGQRQRRENFAVRGSRVIHREAKSNGRLGGYEL